jgi:hypothetical protein
MDDLDKALEEISSIRRHVARSTEFRGYGSATLAATSGFAILAAAVQAHWIPDPYSRISTYLSIWITTAILSAALIGLQTIHRTRRVHSGMADDMLRMAIEQFLPSFVAGALVTIVLFKFAPFALWMLPGLWQLIFGLGVFSSCRFLPRPMLAAGIWYLATGLMCIAMGDTRALSPWTMGISYGIGQLLVAGVMFFATQEATDEV